MTHDRPTIVRRRLDDIARCCDVKAFPKDASIVDVDVGNRPANELSVGRLPCGKHREQIQLNIGCSVCPVRL